MYVTHLAMTGIKLINNRWAWELVPRKVGGTGKEVSIATLRAATTKATITLNPVSRILTQPNTYQMEGGEKKAWKLSRENDLNHRPVSKRSGEERAWKLSRENDRNHRPVSKRSGEEKAWKLSRENDLNHRPVSKRSGEERAWKLRTERELCKPWTQILYTLYGISIFEIIIQVRMTKTFVVQ